MSRSFFLSLFERPVQFSSECYRLYSVEVKCLVDFLMENASSHQLSLKAMLWQQHAEVWLLLSQDLTDALF